MNKFTLTIISCLFIISCNKKEIDGGYDNPLIIGSWLRTQSDFVSANYIRVSTFGEFDYGLVFHEGGTMVERSESGVCIGEACLTENYIGNWQWLGEDVMEVSVNSLKGIKSIQFKVVEIDSKNLRLVEQ